jgi:intracellular sulfur oxidation DsrE/DsrF family protein
MLRLIVTTILVCGLAPTLAREAGAQVALPVPGVEAARDVPGAKEMPNPRTVHKVLFDMANAGPSQTEMHPMLQAVARYVNTLAKTGVPASNRQIAVVFHQGATPYILNDAAYKARNEGRSNPNLAMIQALKKAGVDFRVCGQAVLANKIEMKDITPEIQVDLWALTTIIQLQEQGYVFIAP